MKRFAYLILGVLVLSALAQVAEAGILRRRDGSRRRPLQRTAEVVRGICHGGHCDK